MINSIRQQGPQVEKKKTRRSLTFLKPSIRCPLRGGTEEIRPRFYRTNGGFRVLTHISVAFRLLFSAHNTTFTWSLAGEPSATVALCSETGFLGHVGIGVFKWHRSQIATTYCMKENCRSWMCFCHEWKVYLHFMWFRMNFQFKIVVYVI